MAGFIIEDEQGVKEAFAYERPLNDDSRHALAEYAMATYGVAATLRPMSADEERNFAVHGQSFFVK